uniref:ATP synthase complex subunit 8 n=1 Tax=Leptoxis ampla TaxID=53516 RepID=A0A0M4JTY7_9CAEN|nr:ATP synthase F0 subunit 8 [Leptoxis ampla]
MPQLSPLNWVFLFILLWIICFLVFTLNWWQKKLCYKVFNSKSLKVIENKWTW